jgi:hypothetical protein
MNMRLEISETEMFWGISNNVSYTIPELYFSHDNEYDRTTNHAFIHRVGDKNLYNGIFLFQNTHLLHSAKLNIGI